jgi:cation diffusion facilitator CzcD-associated flavoprotein CzcO
MNRSIVVVGAGPYGLSVAAHLANYDLNFQIFGTPMESWLRNMPAGMVLKSEGFASNLDEPESAFTLGRYCQDRSLPYADNGLPVSREIFASYGMEFHKRFAPALDTRRVVRLDRSPQGFQLQLSDGERVTAERVVLAVGLTYFHQLPQVLSHLSEEFVTHSSRHSTFEEFRGKEVVVLGAGASAMDVAAGLLGAGASVQGVARRPKVIFHDAPASSRRSWMEELRAPMNGLGPGWRSLACVKAPLLFHMMPEGFRLEVARRHLGPAAGWSTKAQVQGKMSFHLGCNILQAGVEAGRVRLEIEQADGAKKTVMADHVISATGYRVDINRVPFLSESLRAGIRCADNTPVLSSHFESSIPGLYFTGIAAASSFGPLMRFVYGTRFASRRLSRHLAASMAKRYVSGVTTKAA